MDRNRETTEQTSVGINYVSFFNSLVICNLDAPTNALFVDPPHDPQVLIRGHNKQ